MADHARAVIIGGGVGGTSIAYHLAERGWTDIVLVDRAELTSGSTFHSAGLVGQLRGSVTLTKMMMYGADAVPAPPRRDGRRPVVARGRVAPAGLVEGALRGAPAPGRLGEDVRAAARADLGRGGARPLPADVDRRRPRRGLAADRRLARPVRAGAGARGRRPEARRDDPDPHPRRRDRRRARPRDRRRGRAPRRLARDDRDRRRRQRRRDVRPGDRPAGRRHDPDHPDGPPVPLHRGDRGRPRRPAPAPRPGQPRLLPRGGRRAVHGRLRAQPGAVVARRRPGRTSTASCSRPTGRGSRRSWPARSGGCRRSPTPASRG